MNKLIVNIFLLFFGVLIGILVNDNFFNTKNTSQNDNLLIKTGSENVNSNLFNDSILIEKKSYLSYMTFNPLDSEFKGKVFDFLFYNELYSEFNWENFSKSDILSINTDEFITILPMSLNLILKEVLSQNNTNKDLCYNYLNKNLEDIFKYKTDYYSSFDSINNSYVLNNNGIFNHKFYETYLIFTNYFNEKVFQGNIDCSNYIIEYNKYNCNSFNSYINSNLGSSDILSSSIYAPNIYYINYLNGNISRDLLIDQFCSYE